MKHLRRDYDPRIQDSAHRIPEDEPVFIVRARDLAAPSAVRAWADELDRLGGDPVAAARVRQYADEMAEYGRVNGAKLPDVDHELLEPVGFLTA